jgi:hypothetical protein
LVVNSFTIQYPGKPVITGGLLTWVRKERLMGHQMIPMLNIAEFLNNQPAGDAVSCGNRTDLFKKQRRHDWRSMGLDICHGGDGRYSPALVKVCIQCGAGHASILQGG